MIFYILDSVVGNNQVYVESAMKSIAKEEDYKVIKCSKEKLEILDDNTRPRICIGGELQGIIFYEE